MHPDRQGTSIEGDLAAWHTVVYDNDLSAFDTVYSWLLLDVLRDGQSDDSWFTRVDHSFLMSYREVDCTLDCPWGMVGDANGSGDEEPTIGDISILIDAKFIAGICDEIIICYGEADVNQSGGWAPECDDITISDISHLIDYLFIRGPSVVELPCCYF